MHTTFVVSKLCFWVETVERSHAFLSTAPTPRIKSENNKSFEVLLANYTLRYIFSADSQVNKRIRPQRSILTKLCLCTLPKHDTLNTAKVMVGVSIALGVLVRVLSRGLP